MLRGLYISGTAMRTLDKRMNTLSNNITNADTVGYKSDTFVTRAFNDVLIERLYDPSVLSQTRQVGPLNYGVLVDELVVSHAQGPLRSTERAYDMALAQPDTFFTVETPDGPRYTRAGDFHIDGDGALLTAEGNRVMGRNGPIQASTNPDDRFIVNDWGEVFINDTYVDTLNVVAFDDPAALRKEGSNLFADPSESGANEVTAQVKQGYLEGSNATMATAMIDMMTVARAYETNQRIIQMTDETIGLAANRIGTV